MAQLGSSLFDLVGQVLDTKPNCPPDSARRALNKRIRAVTTRRMWSDLVTFVTVNFPAPYNTGTVNLTTNSNVVNAGAADSQGNVANWPVADYINTTAGGQFASVKQPGYNKVTPAQMTGIIPGQWLYVDAAGFPEAVCPVWTDGVSFLAKFNFPHNTGFTIQASSFAGLQLQPSYPIPTVTAVVTPTQLLIDTAWGGPSLTNNPYTILAALIRPDPNCWRVKFGVDPNQGCPIDVDSYTFEQILIGDPQLTNSQTPSAVVPVPFLNGGGVPQWMPYPLIKTAYYLNLIIVKTWPRLVADQDQSPGFIDAQCFISGAKADVLRQKVLRDIRSIDPYWDVQLAQVYEAEFQQYVEAAEERDESLSHHRLQSYQIAALGNLSADYLRSHPAGGLWPDNFGY